MFSVVSYRFWKRRLRTGVAVTDGMHHDRSNRAVGDIRTLKLTERDLEDARRLLSLLVDGEDDVIDPPAWSNPATWPSKQALLNKAREQVGERRRRIDLFGKAMFGEPAWDILLLLYVADYERRQTLSSLTDRAGATRTTGLRWIGYLEKEQLVRREGHPTDLRKAFIHLTEKGRDALELYLAETIRSAP